MTISNHRNRGRLRALVVVLGIVVATIVVASYFANNIRHTIASELANPGLLDGSSVVAGNPFWFWFDNSPAKLKLSRHSAEELVNSRRVFNDCDQSNRVCHSPVWVADYGFDVDGIDTPRDALCASSSDTAESAEANMHTVCIDPKTDDLYYIDFTLGER